MKGLAQTDFGDITQIMLKSGFGGFENLTEFKPSSIDNLDKEPEREESDSEEIFRVTIRDRKSLNKRIVPIDTSYIKKEIIGVDTSSVTIGRTCTGIIAVVKAAIVFSDHVETFGPYVSHITESNKSEIYNYYMEDIFGLDPASATPQLSKMPDMLRNFLERLVQRYCSTKADGCIILWDGSLGAGKSQFYASELLISFLLDSAKNHGNSVVAVTKKTTLVLSSNENIFSVLASMDGPAVVDVTDKIALLRSGKYKVLGNIFAAKLSYNGLPFRIDVSPSKSSSPSSVLIDLIGNTSFFHGYPLQLRDAHIYAKITKDEALACQRMIASQNNVPIVDTPDIHRLLLSPYG